MNEFDGRLLVSLVLMFGFFLSSGGESSVLSIWVLEFSLSALDSLAPDFVGYLPTCL